MALAVAYFQLVVEDGAGLDQVPVSVAHRVDDQKMVAEENHSAQRASDAVLQPVAFGQFFQTEFLNRVDLEDIRSI